MTRLSDASPLLIIAVIFCVSFTALSLVTYNADQTYRDHVHAACGHPPDPHDFTEYQEYRLTLDQYEFCRSKVR